VSIAEPLQVLSIEIGISDVIEQCLKCVKINLLLNLVQIYIHQLPPVDAAATALHSSSVFEHKLGLQRYVFLGEETIYGVSHLDEATVHRRGMHMDLALK
jgi:hypothetical protein